MIKNVVAFVWLCCAAASTAVAEDPRERDYHVPALNPKHTSKPKVTGWATQRVAEKINRGVVAVPGEDGRVYLGWRLLKTDPQGAAFNVYRSDEGGNPVKLNEEPVVITTDFLDERPAPARPCAYWVRPVVGGHRTGALGEGPADGRRRPPDAPLVHRVPGPVPASADRRCRLGWRRRV